ncbi:DUF6364 family protein [Priestia aryabhattai]|nr:hypothetical protein [Priestia aryabhattai]
MKENMSAYIESNVIQKVEQYAKEEGRSKSNSVERLLKIAFTTIEENKGV